MSCLYQHEVRLKETCSAWPGTGMRRQEKALLDPTSRYGNSIRASDSNGASGFWLGSMGVSCDPSTSFSGAACRRQPSDTSVCLSAPCRTCKPVPYQEPKLETRATISLIDCGAMQNKKACLANPGALGRWGDVSQSVGVTILGRFRDGLSLGPAT